MDGDVFSWYIPFSLLIQREAFSGFSMRNRGILEKSTARAGVIESKDFINRSGMQPKGRVAAETRGPTRFQKPKNSKASEMRGACTLQ